MKTLFHREWLGEGRDRFGPNPLDWKFECILCGHVQCGRDFLALSLFPGKGQECLSPEEIALNRAFMSCIGRWKEGVGCDWTLGGLVQIHTRVVVIGGETIPIFAFAGTKMEDEWS